jgi:hypothetical protein
MILLEILYLNIYWIVLYFEFLAQVNTSCYPANVFADFAHTPCTLGRLFTALLDASSNPSVAGQYCHNPIHLSIPYKFSFTHSALTFRCQIASYDECVK